MNAPLKRLTSRQAEKAEGMAFARAWREANKGRSWSMEPEPARCPACNRAMP